MTSPAPGNWVQWPNGTAALSGVALPQRPTINFLAGTLVDNGPNNSTDYTPPLGVLATALSGQGTDGAVVFDGVATIAGATLSGSTYTLSRDTDYLSATINSGVIVNGNGYRFLSQSITIATGGVLSADGKAGANATTVAAGAAGAASYVGGNTRSLAPGAAGGAGGSNGAGGSGSVGGAISAGNAVYPNGTGAGGASGGSAPATNIAAGGTYSQAPSQASSNRIFPAGVLGVGLNYNSGANEIWGGAGGAGGGVSGANVFGGGGGSGGGVLCVIAGSIANSGTIRAIGGNGGSGNGTSGAGGGGGGGGGGGTLLITTATPITGTGTLSVAGGIGGGGFGTGTTGSAGSAGNLIATVI